MSHAADTLLFKSSSGRHGGQTMTIKEFHDIYHGPRTPAQNKYRTRTKGLWIAGRDDDGRVRVFRIAGVHEQGVQDIYEVTTESGHSISATEDHRHLTKDGWKTVSEIRPGDLLATMGPAEKHKSDVNPDKVPSHIKNGRRALSRWVKDVRADNKCEHCGTSGGRMEIAHLDNNHSNHTPENIRYLCSSCHKTQDYATGSRKIRWTRGRAIVWSPVVSIEWKGKEETYDLEIDSKDHSWVGNGIVTHNSHATVYGITAARSAYLAYHHPLEFYAALLAVATGSDKEKDYRIAVRRRGIKVSSPDVNVSGAEYSVDTAKNRIRKGLGSIKGVGIVASREIEAKQPFDDLDDFIAKVSPSKVTGIKPYLKDGDTSVGTLGLLIEAGAMKSIGVEVCEP